MAVEIQILSGARQGERIELSAEAFQAGDAPGCEVYFDSGRDPGARSRVASFRLKDDGWYLASSGGGELLVNERPVIGVSRIRSGDVVRLSDRGPDFSFNILVGRSAGGSSFAGVQPIAAPLQPFATATVAARSDAFAHFAGLRVRRAASGQPGAGAGVPNRALPEAQIVTPSLPATAAPVQVSQGLILALAGLALCCMMFLGGLAVMVMMNRGAPAAPPVVAAADPIAKPHPKSVDPVPEPKKSPVVTEPAPPPPANGDEAVFKPLRGCVYLLAVENSKQQKTWPFATACAIREDTLLCCANAAVELIKFKKMGLTCWANNPATLTKVEIGDIHVHALFQKLSQDLDKRMYFDFALLTVRGKLPQIAPVASIDELDELKGGTPLVSLSIPHQGELMDRFQSFSPVLTRAKVFIITTLPPAPGPRLMHVKAVMPVNIYGSPVFNMEGKLVGAYSDVAVPPPGQPPIANLNLHFVPVVSPELITSWFEGSGKEVWVPVTVPEPKTAAESKTAAQPKKRP